MSGSVKVEIKNHDGGTTTTESPYTRAGIEVAIEFLQAKLLDEFGAKGICDTGEQKRYTADELREAAGRVVSELYTNPFASMLRQAADDAEELASVKARLEAVVKKCENQMPEQMFIRMNDEASLQVKESVTAILRVARGEGGAE